LFIDLKEVSLFRPGTGGAKQTKPLTVALKRLRALLNTVHSTANENHRSEIGKKTNTAPDNNGFKLECEMDMITEGMGVDMKHGNYYLFSISLLSTCH
jgi:hypothetical protein